MIDGGSTRGASVARGLSQVETDLVAVHDAARPLVTNALIDALVAKLVSEPDAEGVIAAAPVADTIKRVVAPEARIARTEDRTQLWAAQTPQVFRTVALRAAHAAAGTGVAEATDDAMLLEQAGHAVLVEPTTAPNPKVTTAADLQLVGVLLGDR